MTRHYNPAKQVFDDYEDKEDKPETRCDRCGSTDVRWRQQTGCWVLFSLVPGKEHVCELNADDFSELA